MKKYIVLLLIFTLQTLFTQAQLALNNTFNNVIPPSPDASALGKYGSIPVNLSTGIPSVTIPMYTIKAHGLDIPISLDYHAGGVKVEEMASWVGLGWSLNAGGVITRSVVGLPDEASGGYFSQPYDIEGIPDQNSTTKADIYQQINLRTLDLEPDSYFFNFLGKSGRFFIDKNQHISIVPANMNIKMSFSVSVGIITGWKIIDEQGNTFVFGTHETTSVVVGSAGRGAPPTHPFYSAWYLDTIVTALNDTVNFSYQGYGSNYFSRQMAFKYAINADGGSGNGTCTAQNGESYYFNQNSISGKRIAAITFRSGTVLFTKSDANRTDVFNDYSLSSVSVLNNSGKLITEYDLAYSYFNSNNLRPNIMPDSFTTTRLRLDSVNVHTSISMPPYKFSYVSGNLPSIFSFAQDHWGYYNGVNNTTLIPLASIGQGTQLTDRSVNTYTSQIGTLQRITYPTGGTNDFTYESNTASMSAADYNYYLGSLATSNSSNIGWEGALVYDTSTRKGTTSNRDTFYVQPTTIPIDAIGDNFYVTVYTNNSNTCPLGSKICSGQLNTVLHCISNPSIPDRYHLETACTFTNGVGVGVCKIATGETYVLYFALGVAGYSASLNGSYTLPPAPGADSVMTAVGGLRIKKIVDNPTMGTTVTKEYYYTDNLYHDPSKPDTVLESGSINAFPKYDRAADYDIITSGDNGGDLTTCSYEITSSSSLVPLVSGGSAVSYNTVQENTVSGSERHKSVYKYTSSATDRDFINYSYPCVVENSFDYRRGLLLEQTDFNIVDGLYVPVHKKQFQYDLLNDTSIIAMKTACQTTLTDRTNASTGCNAIIFSPYYANTDRIAKTTEHDVLFDNANDSIITNTNYFYDNPSHIYPTRIVTTNSKDQVETTVMKYPLDFNGLSGGQHLGQAILNLQAKNVVSPVIEKYIQLKSSSGQDIGIVNASFNSYSIIIPEPDTLWSIELSSPSTSFVPASVAAGEIAKSTLYKPQLVFGQYDNYGNLLQQTRVNDFDRSYIWDYNGVYPVAQIVNSNAGSVAYTGFESNGTGNWTIGSGVDSITSPVAGRRCYNLNNDISKTGLDPSATYIVSYWSKSSTAFFISGTQSGYPVKGKTVSINNSSWTYYEHKVSGQNAIAITGSGSIDELRLYPVMAQMTTYTYDPLIGVTSQTDINNKITYYEYDGLGRLIDLKDQDGNVIKTIEYHYKGQ